MIIAGSRARKACGPTRAQTQLLRLMAAFRPATPWHGPCKAARMTETLLIVERDADWSEWTRISRALTAPVTVLVQGATESGLAFEKRVQAHVAGAEAPVYLRRS